MSAECAPSSRLRFEKWISAPPYNRLVDRWHGPEGPAYGHYKDGSVQLAWEAWQEAVKTARSAG